MKQHRLQYTKVWETSLLYFKLSPHFDLSGGEAAVGTEAEEDRR